MFRKRSKASSVGAVTMGGELDRELGGEFEREFGGEFEREFGDELEHEVAVRGWRGGAAHRRGAWGRADSKRGFSASGALRAEPLRLFVSYSHQDEDLRRQLDGHLASLHSDGTIGVWHDRKIPAGGEWRESIDQHIESAHIILLLISPGFMASRYCFEIEGKRAIERHRAGEGIVIPIALRPVRWLDTPLGELQCLPRDSRFVESKAFAYINEAFLEVAEGIAEAISQLLRRSDAPPAPDVSAASPANQATGVAPARDVSAASPVGATSPANQATGVAPARDVSAASPATQAGAQAPAPLRFVPAKQEKPPVTILHLSDLHFTEGTKPLEHLGPLIGDLRDLRGGIYMPKLDYLVITGDITQAGQWAEFERAHEFLVGLLKEMNLTPERTLLVPGNHDINWKQEVYDYERARDIDVSALAPGHFAPEGRGYLVRDSKRYAERLCNFRRFYHQLRQREYSPEPAEQFASVLFSENRVHFLAFNSAAEIDEYFPGRSSIDAGAMSGCLLEADGDLRKAREGDSPRLAADASPLRIALFHHPVTGDEKMADVAFMDRLRQGGVELCLHGHVRESREDLFRPFTSRQQLAVVGAGTFAADASHRPESMPRLYNLIRIPRDGAPIQVHTRHMPKAGGAWTGWAVWPGEKDGEKRAFYEVPRAPT